MSRWPWQQTSRKGNKGRKRAKLQMGAVRTATFRSLQCPNDAGVQIGLRVRRQVASWKGPRVGEYRRAPRLRALKQPEGCGPSESAVCRAPSGPQPSGCISVRTTLVSKWLSVFEDKWRPGKAHVLEKYRRAPRLRALKQPEGCGPSESAVCRAPSGPQPSGCISVLTTLVSKSLSVFEDKWRPGKAHALENIDARPD
jgi:hypothetical protein